MKHYFILIYLLTLISCAERIFSEKEKTFANNMSSLLNGARITIKKGIVVNSTPDSYSKFVITINDLALDSTNPESGILFATSMPALALIKDNVLGTNIYKYIEIVIKSKDSQTTTTDYLQSDLFNVYSCAVALEGFTYGLKSVNKDSLLQYSDTAIYKKVPIDSLISLLSNTDITYGITKDVNLNGFKIDTIDKSKSVIFYTTLHRPKAEHKIEIGVDLETKKVNYYNL